MRRLLLLGLLFPATTFAQVSYTVTVTRLRSVADDCDGGIITFCGNAPQDPVYNLWVTDAEANEETSCWIFEDDPEAEYGLWKDIQNLEVSNQTNVATTYLSFDMSGYESDNLTPACSGPSGLGGDDAIIDREFVQQIDLNTLTEGGTANTVTLSLQDVYYAEVEIVWHDLTISVSTIDDVDVQIAPNPSNGNFTVKTEGLTGEKTIEIRDMSGRVVSSQVSTEEISEVHLDGINPGTYLVHVGSEAGELIKRVLIK